MNQDLMRSKAEAFEAIVDAELMELKQIIMTKVNNLVTAAYNQGSQDRYVELSTKRSPDHESRTNQ